MLYYYLLWYFKNHIFITSFTHITNPPHNHHFTVLIFFFKFFSYPYILTNIFHDIHPFFEILKPFKLHRLDHGPETTCKIDKDLALDLYTKMQTIRRIETSAGNLYKEKIVRGFCHLYSGQEACAVGKIYISHQLLTSKFFENLAPFLFSLNFNRNEISNASTR